MKKRIGIPERMYCEPLVGDARSAEIDIERGLTFKQLRQLHEGNMDAVFVSPLDYARENSEYKIVPGIAVSSTRHVDVYFKKGLHRISTMAADPSHAAELILAKIIFTEEFGSVPTILPMVGSVHAKLQKAESALVGGDEVLGDKPEGFGKLDIVEAWEELSGLPYVHGFWCAREGALAPDEIALLRSLRDAGVAALHQRAQELTERRGVALGIIQGYLQSFSYGFDDIRMESVREYLHYAYYYGTLSDIRDLEFIDEAEADLGNPASTTSK